MELHSLSDISISDIFYRMPRKFDFEADFKIVILERDAWDNIPANQEALVFYTDGSRKEGLVAMEIYRGTMKPWVLHRLSFKPKCTQ
jgi:hypothetical protein